MIREGLGAEWTGAAVAAALVLLLWFLAGLRAAGAGPGAVPGGPPRRRGGLRPRRAPRTRARATRSLVPAALALLPLLRVLMVLAFGALVGAGLLGSPLAARNPATILVWNVWWVGVVLLAVLAGRAWCAICPWEALATLLVHRRLWGGAPGGERGSGEGTASLGLRPPRWVRSGALPVLLLLLLTWLELAFGLTASPAGTAALALFVLVLAVAATALFERKAFCRYACPIGWTLGVYGKLSVLAPRPRDPGRCASCTTLECYRGTARVTACPSSLVLGRLHDTTHCTWCGACARSCPGENVTVAARSPALELAAGPPLGRPEAWFAVALFAVTLLHGVTMSPYWEQGVAWLGRAIGDDWRLRVASTLAMGAFIGLVVLLFAAARGAGRDRSRALGLGALALVPGTFAYHLAHNLVHLAGETGPGLARCLEGVLPGSWGETLLGLPRVLPWEAVHALQAGLLVAGLWGGLVVLGRLAGAPGAGPGAAGHTLRGTLLAGRAALPMSGLLLGALALELWLLAQPMVMRH